MQEFGNSYNVQRKPKTQMLYFSIHRPMQLHTTSQPNSVVVAKNKDRKTRLKIVFWKMMPLS